MKLITAQLLALVIVSVLALFSPKFATVVTAACSGCSDSGLVPVAGNGNCPTGPWSDVSGTTCTKSNGCTATDDYQAGHIYSCSSTTNADACCGVAPPPTCQCGGTYPNCNSCGGNTCAAGQCGTYPNCYTCPPAAYGYGCASGGGNGCVWMSGGAYGGDNTCGNYSCTAGLQTCQLTADINPQPVEASQGLQFKFIEGPGINNSNRGYVDVDFSSGGGAVNCPVPSQGQNLQNMTVDGGCNNNNGQTCSWTFNCNAVSSTATEYQTFTAHFTAWIYNYSTNCSIDVPYIVHGCTKPTAATSPNPNNNATDVSVTPSLRWTQSNWGSRGPYSAMVYLFQGNSSNNATNPYSICYLDGADIGAPGNTSPSAPMSCFVWSGNLSGSGYYQGQNVGALRYNSQYNWVVLTYSGCGSVANDPTAFSGPGFITVPQNYFTTYGGNVTSHAIISNASLPSNSYVCQKSQ